MVDIIKESTYQFDLDLCKEMAENIIESLYEQEGKIENFDVGATAFGLFIQSIHILDSYGWTKEELIAEINDHLNTDSEK